MINVTSAVVAIAMQRQRFESAQRTSRKAAVNSYSKSRRDKNTAAGLCINHSKRTPHERPSDGSTRCDACKEARKKKVATDG